MKKEDLRIVSYQRNGALNMFEGGLENEEEMKEVQELLKERKGWFHQWIKGEEYALIENENGEIDKVHYLWIKFLDIE